MYVLNAMYPNWRELRIHESSPGIRGASRKISKECNEYTPTQYFAESEFGYIVNNFINQDLQNQTFEDESFDIVITQDVFEHLYRPDLAFNEIKRTLRSGGAHFFTTPLVNKFNPSEIWSTMNDDGSPLFRKEAEYHHNPIDPKGSPVTMHWGFDIVEYIKKTSGLETEIFQIENLSYGIIAEYNEVLVSKKI